MANAGQYGPFRFNIWAMLRDLVFNNIGILAFSGTPVNGTSGTFAGKAGPGSTITDYSTGSQYINKGTKASPLWSVMGSIKMSYSFAIDGGAIGTITPTNSPTIPANAIILGGSIDITTTLTSGGSATIALGLGSGAQVASLKAATAVASWTVGTTLALIPVFTAATYVKATAATRLTVTVATAALTAGIMNVNLIYVQGS